MDNCENLLTDYPFDPYLLKRSVIYIEPLYKEWGEEEVEELVIPKKERRLTIDQKEELHSLEKMIALAGMKEFSVRN